LETQLVNSTDLGFATASRKGLVDIFHRQLKSDCRLPRHPPKNNIARRINIISYDNYQSPNVKKNNIIGIITLPLTPTTFKKRYKR
jgi:hypothetical protein